MAKFLKAASLMLASVALTAFAAVPYSNPAGSEFPIVALHTMPR